MDSRGIAVVTAYFSKNPPPFVPPTPRFNVPSYLFSNQPISAPGWKTITLAGLETEEQYGYRKLAKLPKIVTHLFLPNYQWFVWHDFNQSVCFNPSSLVAHLERTGATFAGFKHSLRDCPFEEAGVVMGVRESPKAIKVVTDFLRDEGIKPKSGLYELTAFFRKNTRTMNAAFNHWMELVATKSTRDQLTFPYIIKTYKIGIQLLAGTAQKHVGGGNEFFTQYKDPLIVSSRNWN